MGGPWGCGGYRVNPNHGPTRGNRRKSGLKIFGRHLELLELEAGRHGATDEAVIPLAARHLPGAWRHHQLRNLGLVDVIAQDIAVSANRQLQWRAAIKMPDLGRIDAMPARDLPRLEQEIDGGRGGAALAGCFSTGWQRPAIPKGLAEMAPFRMRLQRQHVDQAVRFRHVFPPAPCHRMRESPR